MHIYLEHMYTLQLTIDLRNATTPNMFHIYQNAHIPMPPTPIDHISIEYHYTE